MESQPKINDSDPFDSQQTLGGRLLT